MISNNQQCGQQWANASQEAVFNREFQAFSNCSPTVAAGPPPINPVLLLIEAETI